MMATRIQPLIGCVLYFDDWLRHVFLNDGIDNLWLAFNSLSSVYFLDGCAYLKFSHWLAVYCSLVTSQSSNWLFTLIWWLAEPSAQPKLAGNQDTVLFLPLIPPPYHNHLNTIPSPFNHHLNAHITTVHPLSITIPLQSHHHPTTIPPQSHYHPTTIQSPVKRHITTIPQPFNHHQNTISPPSHNHSITI